MTRSLLPLLMLTACGPKKEVAPAPPPVGWHAEEGWKGQCYFPPDFDELESTGGISARKMARQKALEEQLTQWRGQRQDGVEFVSSLADDVETVLLGRPEQIEAVSRKNLELCKQVMGAGAPLDEWSAWLRALPDKLTAGECLVPFTYTLFDYLEIVGGWQLSVPLCAGNTAEIVATQADRYRITQGGDWMNVTGQAGTVPPSDYPCTKEGCVPGMLIGRFVTEDGVEEIFPIGVTTTYTAPRHGTLSISINDNTWYDNTWYKSGGLEDHTGITISPPGEE